MIRKDPIFKTLMLSRKGTAERPSEVNDPLRFAGEGVTFRAKLIGVLEVNAPRGDRLCQEALGELKMAIKAAGEHKQRIIICIALDGLRLRDERTGDCLYHHAVHKISFIAQDMADPRAFGYIFGSPDQGHRFFGIKTDKNANLVVVAMRDLFQVVYDLKKKDVEKNRQHSYDSSGNKSNGVGHRSDSMDSLDQMIALGSHLSGGRSDIFGIQTADLLNLHSEEKCSNTFDPFASFPASSTSTSKTNSAACLSVSICPPALPPPPSSTLPQATAVLPTSQLKSTFSETFGDAFSSVATLPPPHLSPLAPPPTKSPKPKASSTNISHYSTIRPRKKSGGDSDVSSSSFGNQQSAISLGLPQETTTTSSFLPPPTVTKCSTLNMRKSDKSLGLKSTTAIPRPSSSNSNASSSPRIVDGFNSQPFAVNFSNESELNASKDTGPSDRLDVFTELDPLGTGRSRPYVDKKDFFQELKKTVATPRKLTKQVSTSQVEGLDSHANSKDWRFQSTDDPFGSLHFTPAAEVDPFDTQFANITPPLFSAPIPSSHSGAQPFNLPSVATSTNYSKAAKAIYSSPIKTWKNVLPSMPSPPVAPKDFTSTVKSSSPLLSRSPLPTVLSTNQSDSDDEPHTFTAITAASPDRRRNGQPEREASWPSKLSTCRSGEHVGPQGNLTSVIENCNVPPLELSSSEEDSSSSDDMSPSDVKKQNQEPNFNATTPTTPPQPPPRPPVIRPPPLPPKGQLPVLPQRPVITPTEDLVYSDQQSPPLPIPVRKPKTPLLASMSLTGNGQRLSRRVSREDAEEADNRQRSPASAKSLSKISLLQLSNMSLSELAATLQLPPVRLASMTLTELALRLAELNKIAENNVADPTVGVASRQPCVKRTSASKRYYPPKDREDEEEEEEEEEEDEEEEEEEEQETVEVKPEETEVCYKGGKKYEILSDILEPEQEEEITLPRQVSAPITQNTQNDTRKSEPAVKSSSDRYAALREIMEQDLASTTKQSEDPQESQFANFEGPLAASALMSNSANQENVGVALENEVSDFVLNAESPVMGFEDDFSRIQLTQVIELPQDFNGARSKTTNKPVKNNPSLSSGSADYDPLREDEFTNRSAISVPILWNSGSDGQNSSSSPVKNTIEQTEFGEHSEENGVVSDIEDKFAAFEARFPANPLEGFSDSFTDFDPNSNAISPQPQQQQSMNVNSFNADFDSAFNQEATVKDQEKSIEQLVKSTSVNIFKRVDDPFDDDFFQPDDTETTKVHSSVPAANVNNPGKKPHIQTFSTIVEDPFAWVQPFDDNVHFDDINAEFTP